MLNLPATSLTAGGLAVGLAIPVHFAVPWLKANFKSKKKDWKTLIPFAGGVAYGGMASMCTGGLIAFGAGLITWFGNGAGSLAMWGITGGNTTRAVRATPVELSAEGNIIMFLLTVVVFGLWKAIKSEEKKLAKRGIVCGVLLGLSAVLGGAVAVSVIPAVNNLGAQLLGRVG
ncbi:hypothetical protein [Streptomyces sp. NBC_00893]|uniref:hypothetical protein n=1 Tax=Streptomyces sp. NBC_00893 TaxID=2975862 RepID=UPI0022591610|nr:hypothetical protein [Streptomyces sp. NBC_00893]MCX4851880.1 hypothetical protein [Streptomyces sp. NBC_00893]